MVDESKLEDELKKLSPEERIKKLKELEEKNKKEIEKAQKLIRESEEEIAIEEKIKNVRIPEDQEVDVSKLFKRDEESLEETVAKEKPKIDEETLRENLQYFKSLPTDRIGERVEYLQNRIEETGYINPGQMNEIAAMYEEIRERQDGLKQGSYKSTNDNIEEQLSVARRILGDLYRR